MPNQESGAPKSNLSPEDINFTPVGIKVGGYQAHLLEGIGWNSYEVIPAGEDPNMVVPLEEGSPADLTFDASQEVDGDIIPQTVFATWSSEIALGDFSNIVERYFTATDPLIDTDNIPKDTVHVEILAANAQSSLESIPTALPRPIASDTMQLTLGEYDLDPSTVSDVTIENAAGVFTWTSGSRLMAGMHVENFVNGSIGKGLLAFRDVYSETRDMDESPPVDVFTRNFSRAMISFLSGGVVNPQ